jgi:iron complex outermembrane receptor protein
MRAARLQRNLVRWIAVAAIGPAATVGAAAPVLLPPWVIEETYDRTRPAAREDSFATILGPTSVVTGADWTGRAIGTLAEALRRVPGVMLQESFGGFEPPRFSVRGSGLDSAPTARGIALLADGLPLARADGSFHSGLFDPLLFARVEVYRGTMHMALTPAVLGGVLHAVSPGAGRAPGTTFRGEGGDFGQARAQLSASTPQAHLAASWARSQGWREQSGQERGALLAGSQHRIGDAARLELSAYLAQANYEVPGPLTLAAALSQPRLAPAAVQRDRPRRDSDLARLAAQLKSAGTAGHFAAGVAWMRLRDNFYQLQGNGETDAISDDVTAHATASRRLASGAGEHHLLARATFSSGTNWVERFRNDRSARGPSFGAYAARARTVALSVEDMVWLRPDLAAGIGATALHARRAIDDRFATAGSAATVARGFSIGDLSPRAGLTWQVRRDLVWRAAFSRGVEPPSFDDLIAVQGAYPALSLRSRELREQRATTLELGAQGERGPLDWSVTVYRGGWRDEILRLADANGLPRGAVNAGTTRHEGVETSLRWRLLDGPHRLTLTASSTLGRFVFADDPVYGWNRIAGAPPHVGAAELAYAPPRGFHAAIESTWVAGRTLVDHAGRLGYGGHTLWHGRVGWRRDPRFVVFLAVRNVFGHAHLASSAGVLDVARAPATTAIFLPGSGRTLTVGLEWRR